MRKDLALPVEKLRRICNPKDFGFKDTSSLPPIKGFIGQKRAVEAIKFGLEVDNPDYHIFATGFSGKGKKMAVLRESLEKIAEERTTAGDFILQDICCLYNFDGPNRPKIVFLERGGGRKFKRRMEEVLSALKRDLPDFFLSKGYLAAREDIANRLNDGRKRLFDSLNSEARKVGLFFVEDSNGYPWLTIASKETGQDKKLKEMPQEEYNSLPQAEKQRLIKARKMMEKLTQETFQEMRDLETAVNQELKKLEESAVRVRLGFIFSSLYGEYSETEKIVNYLRGLEEYVFCNVNLFMPQQNNGSAQASDNFTAVFSKESGIDSFLPFTINLLVDNSEKNGPPIIFESNPTFLNLFCEIGKKSVLGSHFTDHTCFKAGSLAQANGGYLILNVRDVLEEPGVWQKLRKTLHHQVLEFEEPFSGLGIASPVRPEPIPVNLKVIMVGESDLYHLLLQFDPEFLSIFKVKAEFDSEMPLDRENKENYASFVSLCCQKENLLPFDPTGVAKVVEQGSRLAGSQLKLSTEFDEIKDLVIESSHWAKKDGSSTVGADHVRKALEAQHLRLNLPENKSLEFIGQGMLLIDTEGEKVGQINGLSVYDYGDFSFGRPLKITARTFKGAKGVISIQKEAGLSGPIHNKSILILAGYFSAEYGKYISISFSASICFEQSYGKAEGDSASVAELIVLLSSLSDLPVKQSLAVTGSINQFGQIQPIGGANKKIEGFFDVCKERGLTGNQGVCIPHQNVQDLMLREDVVEAAKAGLFKVYSIKTIDDAIELLLGKSADEVHRQAKKYLIEISKSSKA